MTAFRNDNQLCKHAFTSARKTAQYEHGRLCGK